MPVLGNNKLTSTKEQTVKVEQVQNRQIIAIEPTQPDMVYVPYYDPGVVYGAWPYADYPPYYWPAPGNFGAGLIAGGIAFGAGYALGRWAAGGGYWGGGFNWNNNNINFNRPINGAGTNWQRGSGNRQGLGGGGRQQGLGNRGVGNRGNVGNRAGVGNRGNVGNRGGGNRAAGAEIAGTAGMRRIAVEVVKISRRAVAVAVAAGCMLIAAAECMQWGGCAAEADSAVAVVVAGFRGGGGLEIR